MVGLVSSYQKGLHMYLSSAPQGRHISCCRARLPRLTPAFRPLVSPVERAAFPRLAPVGAAFFVAPCEPLLIGLRETSALVDRAELAAGVAPMCASAPPVHREPVATVRSRNQGYNKLTEAQANYTFSLMDEAQDARRTPGEDEAIEAWSNGDNARMDDIMGIMMARAERTNYLLNGHIRFAEFSVANLGKAEYNGTWIRQATCDRKALQWLAFHLEAKCDAILETPARDWDHLSKLIGAYEDTLALRVFVANRRNSLHNLAHAQSQAKREGYNHGRKGDKKRRRF